MTAVTSTTRPDRPAARPAIAPIPMTRLVSVELRKMFDTRSGFWLMISIAIAAVLASGAVMIWAPDDSLQYSTFASAIGIPMAVILPIIATLSVTSEWSQRSGLTTFTLVPHRNRVILAKFAGVILIGVASMLLAMGIGALGELLGTAINGVDPKWDVPVAVFFQILLGNVLGLLVGFMLGLLIRNSAGAIVAYFVYSFVVPGISAALAAAAEWYRNIQAWVDFNTATSVLFGDDLTGQQWAQIGVTSIFWLILPLFIGIYFVLRSEVK